MRRVVDVERIVKAIREQADDHLRGAQLPGDFHRDPADCLIVATARVLDATLVTHDRAIRRYAEQGHVRVLAG